jgi:hypothetical protein
LISMAYFLSDALIHRPATKGASHGRVISPGWRLVGTHCRSSAIATRSGAS